MCASSIAPIGTPIAAADDERRDLRQSSACRQLPHA